jgi:hypothetical protein
MVSMKPTHRIYLKMALAREPQQVQAITAQFLEINVKAHVEVGGEHWYRVTGAGGSWAHGKFYGMYLEGVHTLLGMRMLLHQNHWYANADDLDLSLAHPSKRRRTLPARPIMFLVLAGAFALALAAADQQVFGIPFPWRMYWAWAVGMLLWMSVWEYEQGK